MNKYIACIVLCLCIFTACVEKTITGRIAITHLSIDTDAFALKLGETRTLLAAIFPENATDPKLLWGSDNEEIAKVDPNTGAVTACGLGQTRIWVRPSTDSTPESSCKITVMATKPYVVGDLYPDASKPQGIVFWIDPENPIKGKLVSLDQTQKAWGRNDVETLAQSLEQGCDNLIRIQSLEEWAYNYPAFAWCASKGDGWYLPSLNELLLLYESKTVLDQVIQENGDIPFVSGDYWSSTERRINPKSTAISVVFRHTLNNESWASKDGICHVRAIKVF